jgi:hypothetical protein
LSHVAREDSVEEEPVRMSEVSPPLKPPSPAASVRKSVYIE